MRDLKCSFADTDLRGIKTLPHVPEIHRPTIKLTVVVALPPMFERCEVTCAFYLILARGTRYLLETVQRHAHAGGADWMTAAN